MNKYVLNENVYSKIKNALEMPDTHGGHTDENFFKSVYSPATLMNDWYEKRVGETSETKSSEPLLSENMDKFRPYCKYGFPDRGNYFNQIFESYGLGQELLTDHLGFSYYDNYTTSYDLMYNHLKKGICGPIPRHYFKGQYKPETDLSDIYGSLTQWGLKEKVYKAIELTNCQEESLKSETLSEFIPYDLYTVKKLNDFKHFKKIKAVF